MPERPAEDTVRRVKCEFLEMPGLRLTEPQACRLWGLSATDCTEVLRMLIDAGFLLRTRDGAFMRVERTMAVRTELPLLTRASSKLPAA